MNVETIARDLCSYDDQREHGALYNTKTGKIVWKSGAGKYDQMFVPQKYWDMEGKENFLFVHNHPLSWIGTIMIWQPLSPEDLFTTAYCDYRGVVATDGMNMYTMLRPRTGWGKILNYNSKNFHNAIYPKIEKITDVYKEKVKKLEINPRTYYEMGQVSIYYKAYRDAFGLEMDTKPMRRPSYYSKIDSWAIPPKEIPKWMKNSPKLMKNLQETWENEKKKLGF